jgi:LmbE family N-acetylglucosaminyl deacetylase
VSVLIVVAHPDDEVLGCGGFAAISTAKGETVTSCILCGDVEARQNRPPSEEFRKDIARAHEILGLKPAIFGTFHNLHMNVVPHVELVQFIEMAIERTQATSILTHHPGDLNDDHRQVTNACLAASRLYQRSPGRAPIVAAVHFMEILSSTDWGFPQDILPFMPNTFCELPETVLQSKIEALRAYRGVMRESPHPRREEVMRGLAAYRGAQAGVRYAEAFQTAFARIG